MARDHWKAELEAATMAQSLTGKERAAVQSFLGRVRGEGGPDSDVDVLVVVATDDLPVRRQIFDVAYEVFLETDVLISPLVLSREGFAALRQSGRRLAREIERDGVAV